MAGVQSRDFDSPDEVRTPEKTQVHVVRMGETTIRAILRSSLGGGGRNAWPRVPRPRMGRFDLMRS